MTPNSNGGPDQGPQPRYDDPRLRAYRAAARVTRGRMSAEAPLDERALTEVERSDIVVVPGNYDHVERVLDALQLPYTRVGTHQVGSLRLRPEQLLIVNCPGQIDARASAAVRDFVASGGSLFTTDWALKHVIEPTFPGIVAYNERPTADAVVRIEIADHDNPFLDGVLDDGDDPVWWLEGSSYPIRVLDDRVDVLLSSDELEQKWGESAVAVTFTHGEGEVFHMISHYYLQRTETRTARHASPAMAYASSKGVALSAEQRAEMADLNLSDVESAAASARYLANIVARKKRGGAGRGGRPS